MTIIQKTKQVHISELKQGDTIILNGEPETVERIYLKRGFTGTCYKGDSHYETKGIVEIALFPKWFQGEIKSWHTQI